MGLTNARLGIKRIFRAELLQLFGAIVILIAVLFSILQTGLGAESYENALFFFFTNVLVIFGGALIVAGFVLSLIGVHTAAKDCALFKKAFLYLVIGICATVIHYVFEMIEVKWAWFVGDTFDLIETIAELLTVHYIADGIIEIAERIEDEKMQRIGRKFRWMLICVYAIEGLLIVLEIVFKATLRDTLAPAVVNVLTSVLSSGKYLVYIAFLKRANAMDWNTDKPIGPELEL